MSTGPARFDSARLERPALRGLDVVTTLADFALVTWAVEPERLAALLPEGFTAETRVVDGKPRAFVSAVPFRDLDFRFTFAPWARFSFGQTNYRAYVRYQGRPAVWFFGTSLDTVFVAVPRYLWKLPWHPARIALDTRWSAAGLEHYRLHTEGRWGRARLWLEGTDEPIGVPQGFADEEDARVILTHPLDGYFTQRDGRVGSYAVWHDKLELSRAAVKEASFSVFEELGLVAPGAPPHSALVQRRTEFVIRLPPKPL